MALPTISVRDGSGTPTIVNNVNSGRQNAIDSSASVMANEDFAAIGALTETAPTTDIASSGLNGRLQRIAQRITSLITALGSPFQAGGSIGNTAFGINGTLPAYAATPTFNVGTTPTNISTTRTYSLTNALRVSFTATSTTESVLPTLGTSREVRFAASSRCWVKWGATGLTAAAAEAASFVLEANAPEVIVIPAGATHYRVIRDTTDGNLLMTPVA